MKTKLVIMFVLLAARCLAQLPEMNDPGKFPAQLNQWFTDSIDGRPIGFYLDHAGIDQYAKLFYQGAFAVSDDSLTFAFCDSVLTNDKEKREFYIYVFNSVLKLADGALAEGVTGYCRAFLEKYPCEFVQLKTNKLYSDNYDTWIDFAGYEYYFEEDPVQAVNAIMDSLKTKAEFDCSNIDGELDLIRGKLLNLRHARE
jgi:hypothetical protein